MDPVSPDHLTRHLADLLPTTRLTRVVDIGANPLEDEPPYLAMLREGLCHVTGFEPQPEALERLRAEASEFESYLPHVIGDGDEHTLHLCEWSGFTSLFEPDPDQLELLVDFPRIAAVTGTKRVRTIRLDDVPQVRVLDHLKMDVQGAELMVLRHGREALRHATSVQVEVNFHRIYRDQPTAAELDLELRAQGFVPQQVVAHKTWPLAPVVWADPLEQASRQLVEADVLYIRDLARWDELEDDQLCHLALACHGMYGQFGVALRVVRELVARGRLSAGAVDEYRALVRPLVDA